MKVSRQTLQTIVNYKHVASNDETRPFLCAIALRAKDGELELTACDGYSMIRSSHVVDDIDFPDEGVHLEYKLIHRDELAILDTYLKMNKTYLKFDLTIDEEYLKIGDITIRLLQREYPPVDRHFTTNKDADAKLPNIGFNPVVLNRIVKAIAPTAAGQRRIKAISLVFGKNELSPIYFAKTLDGVKHEAILMPCKV